MGTKSNQSQWRETAFRLLGVLAASVLIALNLKSFVQAGDLFPGGFTGLTRLIQRCALEFWGITLPFAPINLMFNAVPAFVSYKLVGKRFTFYSCLVIAVSSVMTDLLPVINITEDILLISVFGGMLSGFAGGVALKARVTCGGTDFIAIPLAERKNVDAWNYILCGNVVMLAVAGMLFGWDKALYSIIFQFTSTQVVRMMDPENKRATLFIVTGRETAGGVCAQIQDTRHTATLIEGVGLYNGAPCVMIYSVVSYNQIRSLTRKVRQADPKAFVNVLRTDKLMGNFYRSPRD
ncbi:YitT family protein [Pseudoflavonifractor phocaeensis]|uniref:YitT family protein n=1 Tax=Pseudoflavonifractor phocaeensis TaxID=1870988 RepID=UPI001F3E54CF|nr:YitT family protein [Pseudoflavonifractor phocaeensis]MCF2661425.1 YitT family protein [Pseudoflavonifractor phocaeensis]